MYETRANILTSDDLLTESRSLLLYAGVGATGTTVHFIILFLFLDYIGPVAASTLGAVAGCIVNYFLARHFVFLTSSPCRYSFPRFVTVAIFGIAVNAVVIRTFVAALPIVVNQLLASGAVLLLGYSLNKWWTFNEHSI